MNEAVYRIWMVIVFGAANARMWKYIPSDCNGEKAYEILSACNELSAVEKKKRDTYTLKQAEEIYHYCLQQNIKVTSVDDLDYPEVFRHITCPPPVIFTQGNYDLLRRQPMLTVVGARDATEYSLKITRKIVGDAARSGMVIVSGFAVGIDGTAHLAAIENGSDTIAILGCGINYDYPWQHRTLRQQIIQHGLLLTEFLPGTKPYPANFPARNRLLSILGAGTLVIQAQMGSGSLITATLAMENGRDVFCIPPADILDSRYMGVVDFLREGAIPVFSAGDILDQYYEDYSYRFLVDDTKQSYMIRKGRIHLQTDLMTESQQESLAIKQQDTESEMKSEKESSLTEEQPKLDVSTIEDATQRRVAEYISEQGTCHADELACALDLSASELFSVLGEMELDGILQSLPGKRYRLC